MALRTRSNSAAAADNFIKVGGRPVKIGSAIMLNKTGRSRSKTATGMDAVTELAVLHNISGRDRFKAFEAAEIVTDIESLNSGEGSQSRRNSIAEVVCECGCSFML